MVILLKKAGKLSTFTKELFHSNDVKNNQLTAVAVLILGIMYLAVAVLFNVEAYDTLSINVGKILMAIGFFDVFVSFIAILLHFDNKILRGFLIASITISSGIIYFLYPMVAFFVTYGPVLISALYYDKKFIHRVAVINYFFVCTLLWLNVYFENASAFIKELHDFTSTIIWQYPMDVFFYQFIPHTITYLITMFLCIRIAKNGNSMIQSNAEESSKNARIEAELNAASNIQRSSLPTAEFADDFISINAVMKPAKIVGGDFYDYFYLGNDIVVLIADVSDKGISAAMFMMKAKNAIRLEMQNGKKLEAAICSVNNMLNKDNDDNMFVTLWVAAINKITGVGKYVNCGHSSPIIKHRDGKIYTLNSKENTVLGVFENYDFQSYVLKLSQDDKILLFTDGLTDAINSNDEFFGEERVAEIFKKSSNENNVCDILLNNVKAFANGTEQFDDITALELSFKNVENYPSRSVTLSSNYDSVESFIDVINKELEEIACPNEAKQNINVVIDELCSNIIDHAYESDFKAFDIEYQVGENFVNLTFKDSGIPFDPTKFDSAIDNTKIGGLGIYLVKNLVDEIEYSRKDDKNILTVKIIF